jgi:glycosyltransferase involved in cell wall biosynthesis
MSAEASSKVSSTDGDDSAAQGIDFSIVIPVYNEEESLPRLYDALQDALNGCHIPGQGDAPDPRELVWEVLLIDDGSRDESWRIMCDLHQRDRRFRVIRFRRNFGQTAAFSAGFDHARGKVVITMDADLQNDPHDIPLLLQTMREGDYDVVSGWRVNRQDALVMRKIPSRIANRLISSATGVSLHDYGCSLKAYRREVVQNIHLYGDLHRFVPAVANWMGIRLAEVPVRHHPRRYGKSKYGISRTIRVILDLFTVSFLLNYAVKPMQIFGRWGLLSGFVGVALALYLSILKIFLGQPLSQRPLLWLAVLLIIVGVQFVSLGLLGELVIRTYYETQHKPIYAIRETRDD